ncbi:MAG: SMP-30/gluconolactonase/LRE family protein [Hyphomicrobiaceae bacterium]
MSFCRSYQPEPATYALGNAPVKQLATGIDWVGGPVWSGDADCLLFTDIPSDCMRRWTPDLGTSTFHQPSHFANGNTRDREGRLIVRDHGKRRVKRTTSVASILQENFKVRC